MQWCPIVIETSGVGNLGFATKGVKNENRRLFFVHVFF